MAFSEVEQPHQRRAVNKPTNATLKVCQGCAPGSQKCRVRHLIHNPNEIKTDFDNYRKSKSGLVRITVLNDNRPSEGRDYLVNALQKFSPVLDKVLQHRSLKTFPQTNPVKSYSPGGDALRPHLALRYAPAQDYWEVLDNMAARGAGHDPKKASFAETLDLLQYAKLYRIAVWLGVAYAQDALTELMYTAAQGLITPEVAKGLFVEFEPGSLPREVAVISIAEHCIAMVLEMGMSETEVWTSTVVRKFGDLSRVRAEVWTYWRRMLSIRQGKRATFASKNITIGNAKNADMSQNGKTKADASYECPDPGVSGGFDCAVADRKQSNGCGIELGEETTWELIEHE